MRHERPLNIIGGTNLKRRHYWIVVYCTLASVLTLTRYLNVDRHRYRDREEEHARILNAGAERPINIRVLQPLLVESFAKHGSIFSREFTFQLGYCAIRWVSLLVIFIAFETFLLHFTDLHAARMAVLLLAAVLPLSFYGYYYQPTGITDTAAFALGLVLVVRGLFWPLIPLLIVATLNRNTAAFIGGAWFLWRLPEVMRTPRKAGVLVIQCAILGACWGAVVLTLEHFYPSDEWVALPSEFIRYNLTSKRGWLLGAVMFFPLAVSLIYGRRLVPTAARWLVLLAIPYIVIHFVMGHLDKVRYWINLYLLLGPFIVAAYRRYAPPSAPST